MVATATEGAGSGRQTLSVVGLRRDPDEPRQVRNGARRGMCALWCAGDAGRPMKNRLAA